MTMLMGKGILKVLPVLAMLAGLSACGQEPEPKDPTPFIPADHSTCGRKREPMVMAGFIDAMIRDLGASDAKTRWNAANGLGHVGPAAESAAPALFCCAEEDEDCSVREAARVALGKIFPKLAMARSDR